MPILTESTLTEGNKVGGLKVAPPSNDTYQSAASVSTNSFPMTGASGHNTFRPDIYRVSEGYIA